MSDIEDEQLMTINDIKKMKKEKKVLSQETKDKRAANMKKALDARAAKYQERKKLKEVENNLKDLLIDNDKENNKLDDDILNELNTKLKPQLKKENKVEEQEIKGSGQKINDNNELVEMVKLMNKRLDKLYTMKKMKLNQPKKEIQPIIIDNNKSENKQLSLLESIRNKMINQY